MNELELAWKNAMSLRKGEDRGTYIGTITKGTTDYIFYKNGGEYRYESRRRQQA